MNTQEWTNVAVAVGTFALAAVTVYLGRKTRQSVLAAQEQADLTQLAVDEARRQTLLTERAVAAAEHGTTAAATSAEAAQESVKEAARARSDTQAPSVVAFLEPIAWPPLLDINRQRMPQANDLRLLDTLSIQRSRQVQESEEFVFDQDAGAFLWFRMRGLLVNEGRSSARVRLDGEAQFIEENSPFEQRPTAIAASRSTRPPRLPAQVGTYVPKSGLSAEYVLRPGQEAVLEWASGHTLKEWSEAYEQPNPPNPKGRLFFSVTVFDYFGGGVTDWIFIEAAGRPIEPVPGRNASWRLAAQNTMATVAYPNVRHYKADKQAPPTPPWV